MLVREVGKRKRKRRREGGRGGIGYGVVCIAVKGRI